MTAPSEQKTARSPIGEFGDLILRNRVGMCRRLACGRTAAGLDVADSAGLDRVQHRLAPQCLGCLTPTDYAEAWAAGHRTHNERINKGSGQRGVALHCCPRDLVLRLNSDLRQGVA